MDNSQFSLMLQLGGGLLIVVALGAVFFFWRKPKGRTESSSAIATQKSDKLGESEAKALENGTKELSADFLKSRKTERSTVATSAAAVPDGLSSKESTAGGVPGSIAESPSATPNTTITKEVSAVPLALKLRSVEDALLNTKKSIFGRIRDVFLGDDQAAHHRDELEEILYTSDLGPRTVQRLMASVEEKVGHYRASDLPAIRTVLRGEMLSILEKADSGPMIWTVASSHLQVWMIVGVNGAGKTTTIGKLGHKLAQQGHKVLIAAGDTFRAAAGEQLKVWSERAKVEIFYPDGVTSPSAVAFDACKKAEAGGFSALIIDTAGRLHTQKPLMEELKKMRRVIEKAIPQAPHEVLLVLDANAGQNALIQAREFQETLGVTGVVLTKMDGTAKGGVAVGVACELGIPVKLIGMGEAIEDIRAFAPAEFVDSII